MKKTKRKKEDRGAYEPHKLRSSALVTGTRERQQRIERNKVEYAQLSSLHQLSEDNQKGGNQQGARVVWYRRANVQVCRSVESILDVDTTCRLDSGK